MPDRNVPFHHPAIGAALDGRFLTSLFDDADASPQHGSPSSGQQSSSSSYADPASSSSYSSYNSSTIPPPAQVQAQALEGDYRNVDEERDRNQTIRMTVFFLVLMVVYVGFCSFYLRKKRGWRAVGDNGGGEERGGAIEGSRRRQRLENQVILNESSEAAARARTNPSIHAKLKARMANIKQALYVRVIVDDDEGIEEEEGGGGGMEDRTDGVRRRRHGGGEDDASGATTDRAASAPAPTAAVGVVLPTPPASALAERRIVIIVEEEEEEEEGDEGGGIAPPPPRPQAPSEGAAGVPTVSTAEDDRRPRSSDSSPRDPPRLSLSSSSSKRYTDALNCGGRRSHYSDALNCGSAACSGNHAIVGGGGGGVPPPASSRPSPEAHSVPISTIVSTYGEECNICLGVFQVGDHAAWSIRHGEDDAACRHVFHEECITRWLLVRDRCPICRESYFPTDASTGTIVAAADDRAGGDDGPDLERGENGDDVSPDVEIRSTPLFRRMIDRFGPAP